jgi:hypothetical protein
MRERRRPSRKKTAKNSGFSTTTLMDCMAEMPPAGERRPRALMMKAEKAKKIPATRLAPRADRNVSANIKRSIPLVALPEVRRLSRN